MNAIYKFVMAMLAKSGGKTGLTTIQRGKGLNVELSVKQIEQTLKNMGVDVSKITSPKEVEKFLNIQKSWLNQQTKGSTIGEHRVIDATSPEGKEITESLFGKKGEVVDLSGKKIDTSKPILGGKNVPETDIVTESIILIKSKKPIDAMAEANSVIGRKGKYKNLTKEQSKKILKDTEDHIFERDIKYDEFGEIIKPDSEDFAHGGRSGSGLNYLLGEDDQNSRVPYGEGSTTQDDFNQFLKEREQRDKDEEKRKLKKDYEDWKKWHETQGGTADFAADGGRIGFGLGGIDKARRLFLKWAGAGAATAGAAKSGLFGLLKGGGKKQVVETLTQVPIKAGVDGMPVWFKPLVNKVIKDGKEIGSTVERQIVHEAQLPGSKTPIHVTQDLNTGNVVVDIGVTKHGFPDGHLGQPVSLEYRAGEWVEPTVLKGETPSKGTKTKEEFWVEEAEFTGGHPENIKFEESTIEKFGEHGSDFSEVEKFATGKVTKASKIGNVGKATPDSSWTPDDFASGGRVPLGEGGDPGTSSAEEVREAWKDYLKEKEKGTFRGSWQEWQPIWIRANLAQGGRVPLAGGKGVMSLLKLLQKKFPGTTKLGQTSKMMAPKTELKRSIAGFQEREAAKKIDDLGGSKVDPFSKDFDYRAEADLIAKTPYTASELKQLIIKKYKGKVDDRILQQMLTDDNPQRLAEVMATIDEGLIMQQKGMGPETIIQTIKDSWKRKKQATGGRVSLSAGGLAGMLGE